LGYDSNELFNANVLHEHKLQEQRLATGSHYQMTDEEAAY
jgi:hypothetical protein